MKLEDLVPFSQDPAVCSYPEPDELIPRLPNLFLEYTF
jgi:hypothetical protein